LFALGFSVHRQEKNWQFITGFGIPNVIHVGIEKRLNSLIQSGFQFGFMQYVDGNS